MVEPYATLSNNVSPSYRARQCKRRLVGSSMNHLDRVNVLGDDVSGHTGCVNAVDWARDGEVLITGGDDTTVRLWRADSSDLDTAAPYKCTVVLHTGHTQNIFSAKMLPGSSKIVSVAGDDQVRVYDVEGGASLLPGPARETEYVAHRGGRVLRCHGSRVKRIVAEGSADLFLTVSEDGTVRQHDLRTSHHCRRRTACPAPLLSLPFELSAISLSPMTPYQLLAAGESPTGYLFDRRHVGRYLKQEWGVPPREEDITTCVRRFARGSGQRQIGRAHITGARMSSTNGHELLLSYSGDDVYMFSTRDDPAEVVRRPSPLLAPNPKRQRKNPVRTAPTREFPDAMEEDDDVDDEPMVQEENEEDIRDEFSEEEDSEAEEDEDEEDDLDAMRNIPRILPRSRFHGASNVKTIKDVNFLGPNDEFVTSGSDDGNVFIWNKSNGQLVDILEGDDHIVNVIEGHPHLPVMAVSGIDTTIKIFAPQHQEPSLFSRLADAEEIIKRNEAASRRNVGLFGELDEGMEQFLTAMAMRALRPPGAQGEEGRPECTHQ